MDYYNVKFILFILSPFWNLGLDLDVGLRLCQLHGYMYPENVYFPYKPELVLKTALEKKMTT